MEYKEVAEEKEDLTLKSLMIAYDYDYIRKELDNYYTDYDCKMIAKRLKTFAMNRELGYLVNHYNYTFQQAIDKLIDLNILRLW